MRCWLLSTFLYLILHLTCAEVSLLCEISTRVSFSSLDGLVSTSFEFSGILPGCLTSFVGNSKSYYNQTFASATFFRAMFFYKCAYDQFSNNLNRKTFQTQIFTLSKIRWTLWDFFSCPEVEVDGEKLAQNLTVFQLIKHPTESLGAERKRRYGLENV